jgi:hypothetical protein
MDKNNREGAPMMKQGQSSKVQMVDLLLLVGLKVLEQVVMICI